MKGKQAEPHKSSLQKVWRCLFCFGPEWNYLEILSVISCKIETKWSFLIRDRTCQIAMQSFKRHQWEGFSHPNSPPVCYSRVVPHVNVDGWLDVYLLRRGQKAQTSGSDKIWKWDQRSRVEIRWIHIWGNKFGLMLRRPYPGDLGSRWRPSKIMVSSGRLELSCGEPEARFRTSDTTCVSYSFS